MVELHDNSKIHFSWPNSSNSNNFDTFFKCNFYSIFKQTLSCEYINIFLKTARACHKYGKKVFNSEHISQKVCGVP